MATGEDGGGVASRRQDVRFNLSGADLGASRETDSNSSTDDLSGGARLNRARFQVARVDVVDENADDGDSGGGGKRSSSMNQACEGKYLGEEEDEEEGQLSHQSSSSRGALPVDDGCATYKDGAGHNTLESLPHVDHYRNILTVTGGPVRKRPTLMELHDVDMQEETEQQMLDDEENRRLQENVYAVEDLKAHPAVGVFKFGWIKGVLVRCLLNIFGVMLFLRLPWVVGQAGIGLATVIILLASVVTTLTTLSMSAICTNGEVKGGGAYYMISRCLGPEFGGAVGIIFSIANAVAASMYIVGFSETIRDILKSHNCLMVDELNDVRIIGLITFVFMLGVALAGLSWESRAQLVLLAILTIAIVDFCIGTFIPPSATKKEKGFHSYTADIFVENFSPDFRDGHSFFSVFAIFFPAATGILAGANISGDLKDAQKAIPKGTILAILITTVVYLALAWMAGACVQRDAAGPSYLDPSSLLSLVSSLPSDNYTGETTVVMATEQQFTFSAFYSNNSWTMTADDDNSTAGTPTASCVPGTCEYGLQNNMQVMQLVSIFGPITIAGIISATLSSALASLVSAPRVFQAVCKDKIFPYIHIFAKGYGSNDEPRRAYVLACIIGLACICIGDLNAIAPLISNFFLMSYFLINYSCVDASLAKSPGWRPAFRFYSLWLSLLGALLCITVMFIINWWTALLTIALVVLLYFYVHYRKPDINWGSSTQAHVYRNALQHTQKLILVLEHVKNYRPQVLALTAFPGDRPALVDFCAGITKDISLMVCGHVLLGCPEERLKDTQLISKMAYKWLTRRNTKSFYNVVASDSLRLGVQALMQSVGVGKLRPNTLILGFKSDWIQCSAAEVDDYFHIIHDAFDLYYSVGILRLQEGMQTGHVLEDGRGASLLAKPPTSLDVTVNCDPMVSPPSEAAPSTGWSSASANSNEQPPVDQVNNSNKKLGKNQTKETEQQCPKESVRDSGYCVHLGGTETGESDDEDGPEDEGLQQAPIKQDSLEQEQEVNRFNEKQKKGFIDVWWLFDDGGLTLLVPYLMTTKKLWSNCKLRVFMAGRKKNVLDQDQRQLATLLHKFRIEYASMNIITDIGKRPQPESLKEFNSLIADWKLRPQEGETEESHPWKISDQELTIQKSKTYRHVRLRELLQEHSSDANLIVMTLPMPKKGLCSAGLYMAWLDTLTHDMPPILLLRGNQENVLTYYS